jgi:uncharacterized protein YegL
MQSFDYESFRNRNQMITFEPKQVSSNEYRELIASLLRNPGLRTLGVVLVDKSGSMNGVPEREGVPFIKPIEEVNQAMVMMKDEFRRNRYAAEQIMLSVIAFGTDAQIVTKMTPATQFIPPVFVADGLTSMAEAVFLALAEIRKVISFFVSSGVDFNPISFLLLSDGAPSSTQEMLARMTKEFAAMFRQKLIHPIIVVTETGDAHTLEQLFGVKPIRLNMLRMRDLFLWFSQSLETVSMECISPEEFAFPNPYDAKWSQNNDL